MEKENEDPNSLKLTLKHTGAQKYAVIKRSFDGGNGMSNTPHRSKTHGPQFRPPIPPKPKPMTRRRTPHVQNPGPIRTPSRPTRLYARDQRIEHNNCKRPEHVKTSTNEFAIPVIDLTNDDTKQKLAALGITNYIPLISNTAGIYGVPIVSVQGAANPNICNKSGLGVNSLDSNDPN